MYLQAGEVRTADEPLEFAPRRESRDHAQAAQVEDLDDLQPRSARRHKSQGRRETMSSVIKVMEVQPLSRRMHFTDG